MIFVVTFQSGLGWKVTEVVTLLINLMFNNCSLINTIYFCIFMSVSCPLRDCEQSWRSILQLFFQVKIKQELCIPAQISCFPVFLFTNWATMLQSFFCTFIIYTFLKSGTTKEVCECLPGEKYFLLDFDLKNDSRAITYWVDGRTLTKSCAFLVHKKSPSRHISFFKI